MTLDESTRHRVETALLDRDGSCRDINFAEWIPTSGAIGILGFLASSWKLNQAITVEGDEVASDDLPSKLRRPHGSLRTIWNEGCNPQHIQAYFHWLEAEKVFCELTFFPEDFDSETFTLHGFLVMLEQLAFAAESEEYYLRYEDGSWRHGQYQTDSVILSDKALRLSVG